MREETKVDLYAAGVKPREYDESCKRVFKNKEIIAPILQMMVPEYKNSTVEEVIRCIDENSIQDIPVEDVPAEVEGLPTELSSVTEKLIRYDVHFKSVNPILSNGEICVHLHVDLEIQNNYKTGNPSYPIQKRAMYYAARELSAQLGSLTETTDYAKLEKVYSIWICNEKIPKELEDTVTGYHVRKEDIIGKTNEPEEDYDLLNVIMIRRGGESKEKIFDYLKAVFQADIPKLETYTSVSENEELKQEVERMTGLGESLMERGMERGIAYGIQQGMERGKLEESRRIVRELLKAGMGMETIKSCIPSLSYEELEEIDREVDEELGAERSYR